MDTYAGYNDLNSYYNTTNYAGGFLGVLFGILGVFILIILIIAVISVVGQWKILKKAGQPGWPAIIPIYNTYMLCKITGVNPWWILIVFISPIFGIIPVIGTLLTAFVSIYFSIILYVSLAHSFGKDTGWVIGLYLLNPFFMLALGVGQSKYLGPKPMNDVILNKVNNNINVNNNQSSTVDNSQTNTAYTNMGNDQVNTTNNDINNIANSNNTDTETNPNPIENLEDSQASKYCPNCGNKINTDSKFCPNCGRQL